MKRSERDAWVAALRSGKYKQGQRALRHCDTYCCLGVKCDLDGEEWIPCDEGLFKTEDGHVGMPSFAALGYWQMTYREAQSIASLNDGGKSFAEIADWIEANLPVEED